MRLALLVDGIETAVVGVPRRRHGARLHIDADKRPVHHIPVYFLKGLRAIGSVDPGNARETPAEVPDHLHDLVVGDVIAEMSVAPGSDPHGHAGLVHFLQHQFQRLLAHGTRLDHAELRAEVC